MQNVLHYSPPSLRSGVAALLFAALQAKAGGKGIRTPDFQLAKLALYQLSYAPEKTAECSLALADCNRSESPDPDALLRCDEHFFGGLDFERVIPGIGVSNGTNHAKLTRGMRVTYDLLFDVIVSDFSAPGLRPPEKHALISSITIEHRRRLSFERSAISVKREREAAQVRDVFAHG